MHLFWNNDILMSAHWRAIIEKRWENWSSNCCKVNSHWFVEERQLMEIFLTLISLTLIFLGIVALRSIHVCIMVRAFSGGNEHVILPLSNTSENQNCREGFQRWISVCSLICAVPTWIRLESFYFFSFLRRNYPHSFVRPHSLCSRMIDCADLIWIPVALDKDWSLQR